MRRGSNNNNNNNNNNNGRLGSYPKARAPTCKLSKASAGRAKRPHFHVGGAANPHNAWAIAYAFAALAAL